MNLTFLFSRKYRWPEHYFSVWCLGNSQKLLTTNQFLVSTIFFANLEQCNLCCSWPCFRVLLCTHYGPLQCFSTYFRKLKEIGVLLPIFPDCFFLRLWLNHKTNMHIFRWTSTRKQVSELGSTTSKNAFLILTSTGLILMIFIGPENHQFRVSSSRGLARVSCYLMRLP